MSTEFQFDLVSPEKLLVSTGVEHVVVPGVEGDFGVLAGHAPFMTTLRPGLVQIFHRESEPPRVLFLKGGFAEVNDDRLTILAEDGIDPAGVDKSALAADIGNAEEDLRLATDPVEIRRAEEALAWMRPLAELLSA